MPVTAPPTPWSPWAPDCPVPWTEEHRRLLLPRRRGEEKVEPRPAAEAWARMRWSFAQAEPWWRQQIGREDNPDAPLIARLCEQWGTEEPPHPQDPEVEALGLGTLVWAPWSQEGLEEDVIDFWVGTAGFPFALAALVAGRNHYVNAHSYQRYPDPPQYLIYLADQPHFAVHRFSLLADSPAWLRLRRLLATAGEAEWGEAVAAAERLRAGARIDARIVLSYLFPDVLEWGENDAREALESYVGDPSRCGCLASCVRDGDLLAQIVVRGRDPRHSLIRFLAEWNPDATGLALSMIEGAGPGAIPALSALLADSHKLAAGQRRAAADALALLPSEEALVALLDQTTESREAVLGADLFTRRFPRLALGHLAARTGKGASAQAADLLLTGLLSRKEALVAELLPGLPEAGRRAVESLRVRRGLAAREATPDELPAALVQPPGKGKKGKKRMPEFWQPAAFCRPQLRSGAAFPLSALERLGTLLAQSPLGAPDPGLAEVRAACSPASLGSFAWDLFFAWLTAGRPKEQGWAYHALAALGDDECMRRLTPLLAEWTEEGQHHQSKRALEVLAAQGSDTALRQLQILAKRGKGPAVRNGAARQLQAAAEARGLSRGDLEEILMPTFGLGPDGSRELSYGPRSFRVGFDELLRPFVLDTAGKRLKDLPDPGRDDDPEQASTALADWKALKKDVKAVAGLHLRRLEEAMASRHRWEPQAFRERLVRHPLLGHLARRLVWGAWSEGSLLGTFRVSEDGTPADAADSAWEIPEGARIGLVHRLDLGDSAAAAWKRLLDDYEILQPFPQIVREVFQPTNEEREARELVRSTGRRVSTGKLLGLESRGWTRGRHPDTSTSFWIEKPVGPDCLAVIFLEPGIELGNPRSTPQQTLARIVLLDPASREEAVQTLGDLEPVVFSELVRDLEGLG